MKVRHAWFSLLVPSLLALGCQLGQGPTSISTSQASTPAASLAGCTITCHNPTVPPDPTQLSGSGTSGKHIAHMTSDISCDKCHFNYQKQSTHMDGVSQTTGFVIFDSTNPSGRFDSTASTCASVVCHSSETMTWSGSNIDTSSGLSVGGPTTASLVISWTAVTGATNYQVFRDTSATGTFTTRAFNGAATTFTDGSLASGTTYYYKLQTTTPSGVGALSTAVSGLTIPATPAGLAAGSATTTSLAISWTASTGAESYQLFRDTASGGTFSTQVYAGSNASYTDSGLTASTAYYYKVRASNASGTSALSAAAAGSTASPPPPDTPADLAVGSPTSTTLTVSWSAAPGATTYQVFRDTSAGGTFANQVYLGSTTSFTDTSLASSTTYYYKVQAASASGYSALSAAASGATAPPGVPATPTGLAAGSATTTSLSVSWAASTGATAYTVFRDTNATGAFTTQAYSGAATSFTDSTLSSGTAYYYKVQASNVSGSSPLSAAASGATLLVTPAGLAVGSPTSTALTVSWSASSGATGYQVFRDTTSGGTFSTQVYTGAGTSYTDSGLTANTAYYYKVRASNASGTSALSAAATGTTSPLPPPATPAGLTVGSPTSTTLAVSWSASTGATSYDVFRDTTSGGTFATQVYTGSALTFTDSSLSSSTAYYYKVRATNANGSSALSAAASGTTAAPSVPATPTGLGAGSPTVSSLVVTWTASAGATSYQVFRDTTSGGTFATQAYTGSATTFTDSALSSNTTYYYKVRATNAVGSSARSAAASGTTASEEAPATPTGLAAGSATTTSLALSWSSSTGATSYQVYRDTSSTGAFTTQAFSGAATTFTDGTLSSGTTYYYKVQATSGSGSSPLSAAASGNTLLAVPTGLTVGSPTDTSLAISWSASTGAASYQLFRDTSSSGTFTTQVYTGSATSYTDTTLTASTAYYYKVRATNASGSSALSSAVSGTTASPPLPATPAGLAVGSPTSTALTVSWSATTGAASYQLYRDTSSGGTFATQVYTGSATSFTDTGLTASTTYYYKVRATNTAGSSALSAAASGATTSLPAPATPGGLAVGSPTSTTLGVSWSASSGATSYQVFRDTSATGSFTTQAYTGAALSFTDSALTGGTTYYYKVQASNASGASALSAAASGSTVLAVPAGLAVGTPTSTSLTISWSASSGATGYQLFRDTSSGGAFATQVYLGSSLSYTDSGLTTSTTYYYKVRASNAAVSSALSAAASGTTSSAGIPPTPAGLAVGSPTLMALTVSWSASSGAAGYQVFRDTSSSGAFTAQVYTGSSLSFTDTPLNSSTAYYYKVRATNASGSSASSAAVSGTTSAPSAAGCTASCHNASVPPNPIGTGTHTYHINSTHYTCDECHHNYQTASTHLDGTLQTTGFVFFDSTNPSGTFNYTTLSCGSLSCHGSRTW